MIKQSKRFTLKARLLCVLDDQPSVQAIITKLDFPRHNLGFSDAMFSFVIYRFQLTKRLAALLVKVAKRCNITEQVMFE